VRIPRNSAHAGRGDGLEDLLLGHVAGIVRNCHPAIQNVEGQPLLTADDRSDSPFEHRDFLGAIHPAHREGTASREHADWLRTGSRATAAPIRRVPVIVVMVMLVTVVVVVIMLVTMVVVVRVGHRYLRPVSGRW
jgi:hypothetical protein